MSAPFPVWPLPQYYLDANYRPPGGIRTPISRVAPATGIEPACAIVGHLHPTRQQKPGVLPLNYGGIWELCTPPCVSIYPSSYLSPHSDTGNSSTLTPALFLAGVTGCLVRNLLCASPCRRIAFALIECRNRHTHPRSTLLDCGGGSHRRAQHDQRSYNNSHQYNSHCFLSHSLAFLSSGGRRNRTSCLYRKWVTATCGTIPPYWRPPRNCQTPPPTQDAHARVAGRHSLRARECSPPKRHIRHPIRVRQRPRRDLNPCCRFCRAVPILLATQSDLRLPHPEADTTPVVSQMWQRHHNPAYISYSATTFCHQPLSTHHISAYPDEYNLVVISSLS